MDEDYKQVPEAAAFLEHLRFGRDAAEGTCRMYAGELVLYLEWCRGTGRDLVTAARDLSRFVHHLNITPISRAGRGCGQPRGARRINHILCVVREFYKHAAANGTVDASVLTSLYEVGDSRSLPAELRPEGSGLAYHARPRHALRQPRQIRVNRATEAEWEALLEACRSWRDRFLVVLLWFTGLRVGEALGLRRSDVHFADHSADLGCPVAGPHLHVVHRDNINRASAKSRNDRHVPANRWVLAYYSRYLAERDACRPAEGCDFVFVNLFRQPFGMPMRSGAAQELFAALSTRASLARRVTPHMLRHATGSAMADAGIGIDVVQSVLGQASILSTQVYLHPSDDRMRQAVDRLAAVQDRRRNRTELGGGA
ncbi:MAG: tyrosine-type recombinase/integrase [Actinomycetota bacterium]|nr:tyrosine-type recombinase/integrase [Actinomycetota bacterium]